MSGLGGLLSVAAPVLSAVDPALGAAAGAAGTFFGQQSANNLNIDMANENRAWQEQMSNTAHQREVVDLQKAGLNPMISALKSGGATTPAGTVAQAQSSTKDAVNSGQTAALLSAQIDKLKAEAQQADGAAYASRAAGDAAYGFTAPSQGTMYRQGVQNATDFALQNVHEGTVRHLNAQIDQLKAQGRLTEAQTQEAKQRVAESSARELETVLRSMHLDLDLQRARNEADAQLSAWKRNFAPYVNDAGKVIGSATSLGGAGAIGYRLGTSINSARTAGRAAEGLKVPQSLTDRMYNR